MNRYLTAAVLIKLNILHLECKVENWDGYGARPIADKTIENALELAISLCGKGLPIPEFTPEPDGEIALEWYGDDNSVVSVSVAPSGQIAYAAVQSDGCGASGTAFL